MPFTTRRYTLRNMRTGRKLYGKKTTRRGVTTYKKVSKPLRSAIKKVINQGTETKYQREKILDITDTGYTQFNSVINTSADWYRVTPLIQTGTNSSNRIGERITPRSMKLHINCSFNETDALSRDIEVYFICLTSKFQKEYNNEDSGSQLTNKFNAYLKAADDSNDYYNGTFQTVKSRINTDDYTLLHKKTFRLCKASGNANGTGVVGQSDSHGTGLYSPSLHYSKQFTVSFKPPTLKYTSSADTVANNYAPFWAIGYRYLSGQVPDTTGGVLAVSAWSEILFKDE